MRTRQTCKPALILFKNKALTFYRLERGLFIGKDADDPIPITTHAVLRVGEFWLMSSIIQHSDRMAVLKEGETLVIQCIEAIAALHRKTPDKLCWGR